MRKPKNHILDIVPLTRISLTRNQSFWYLSNEKIATGSLVSAPLFHRKVEGIVLNSRDDFKRFGGIKLKNIEKIIEEKFLTEKQLELAKFISDYYISPLGIVMKNFVVKRTKERKKNNQTSRTDTTNPTDCLRLTAEQKEAVNQISKGFSKFLLFGPSSSGKTEVYIHSILEIRKRDPKAQFLILLPEKTLAPQALERYGKYFKPEEISILNSNISKGQHYSAWHKIKSGEAKIIIGTRMAVFAPFQKLGLIVIDEEQDMSFKQWDMNPRYDARTVAEKLAKLNQCPIVRGSATPSIESYYKTINKEYKLLKLPELNIAEPRQDGDKIQNSIIVDMKKERWERNTSCISKKLKSEIAYALKYEQQVILFVNRQGMSTFSVCESCKNILKCPKCDRALIYENSGTYKCPHCNYKTSPIPQCSKCKGLSFKNVGIGTQKVEKEIENFFPGINILRADSQTIKTAGAQDKIYSDFSQKKASILIGTQMISKGWDLRNVSLIGIIDTDNLFSVPDFGTSEKAYQHILQVSGRTSRFGAKFPGVVIIQTYHPENKMLQMANERNFSDFFEKEIKERKDLELPPFGKLVKLVFQDYSLKKISTETQRVYKILENIPGIRATEAQESFVPKIRGRFRRQIIVKYKEKISALLRKELNKLGPGWIIDVDPISLI